MIYYSLLFLFLLFGCEKKKNPENCYFNNSIDSLYIKFLKQFEEINLPAKFDEDFKFNLNSKRIKPEFIKYLIEPINTSAYSRIAYYPVGKIKTNAEIDVILFCKFYPMFESQLILVCYDKKGSPTSKLIIWGNDMRSYVITSIISANLELSITSIYDNGTDAEPFFSDKSFTRIKETKAIYSISNNGRLEMKFNNEIIYIAKKEGGKYIYPVPPPNE